MAEKREDLPILNASEGKEGGMIRIKEKKEWGEFISFSQGLYGKRLIGISWGEGKKMGKKGRSLRRRRLGQREHLEKRKGERGGRRPPEEGFMQRLYEELDKLALHRK